MAESYPSIVGDVRSSIASAALLCLLPLPGAAGRRHCAAARAPQTSRLWHVSPAQKPERSANVNRLIAHLTRLVVPDSHDNRPAHGSTWARIQTEDDMVVGIPRCLLESP